MEKSSKTILTVVGVLVAVVVIISGIVWYRGSYSAKNNAAATALTGQDVTTGQTTGTPGTTPAKPASINVSPAGTPDYVKG